MSDRFDFEQSIQDCWRVTDDIRMIGDSIQDRGLSVVDTSVALAGLAALYELKFNNLWDLFEDVFMNLVRENKMLNEECAAMREQLEFSYDGQGYGAGRNPTNQGAGFGIAAIKPNKVGKK